MILEPPQLAIGTAPELGRVEQDAVVAALAADLARGELGGVIDDPAHRAIAHSRQQGVGAAALDRFLRRIDMDQSRAGVGQRQCADAGVAKQVEDVGVVRQGAHRVPLRRHVGEEAQVAEGGQAGVEADLAARHWPAARNRSMLDPAPAAILVRSGDEGRVGVPFVQRRSPHRLRIGADDRHGSIAFELLPVAAVDQAPIGPRLGDQGEQIGQRHRIRPQAPACRRSRRPRGDRRAMLDRQRERRRHRRCGSRRASRPRA